MGAPCATLPRSPDAGSSNLPFRWLRRRCWPLLPIRTLGVQLYTVRGTLMKDSDHVLRTIAAIGYKEIEGANRADLLALIPTDRRSRHEGLFPATSRRRSSRAIGRNTKA